MCSYALIVGVKRSKNFENPERSLTKTCDFDLLDGCIVVIGGVDSFLCSNLKVAGWSFNSVHRKIANIPGQDTL